MSLWRRLALEAHRRSLWQVLGVYLLGSWIGYQVVLALYDGLALPEWVPALAIVLFVIGLPIVLATAMVQEGPPTLDTLRAVPSTDPTLLPDFAPNALSDAAYAGEARPQPVLQRHLTWRRSIAAGIAAFVFLALGTTGFMTVRSRDTLLAQGVLEESDRIVLADMAARNADADLAYVLTEALRIDLLQSNVVRLAEPTAIADALRRMQSTDSTLTSEQALHAAEREGWKAVIAGELGKVAGQYVLTAQLLAASDGAVLGVFKATAADSTELLSAVSQLSKQLRERVGEKVKSLRASPPLERVTTASLPALRKYVEGSSAYLESGDRLRGIELLDEAIALDSSFAMAYRRKAMFLNNMGVRPQERNDALTRAHALSSRLPEKERLLVSAAYFDIVEADDNAAIAAYRRVLELDSLESTALNNLAVLYNSAGRWAEAETLLERNIAGGHRSQNTNTALMGAQFRQGKFDEARATLEAALQGMPDNADLHRTRAYLAASEFDWSAADSIMHDVAERFRDNPSARVYALRDLAFLATLHGRLSDLPALAAELHTQLRGLPNLQLTVLLDVATVTLRVHGDAERGLRELQQALQKVPLDSMPLNQRPFPRLAELYADAGRFDIAESYVQKTIERSPQRENASGVINARAYIALLRGDGSLMRARITPPGVNCPPCNRDLLARAYDALGQRDSAIAAYETFLTARHWQRLNGDLVDRPAALIRAAELHEAAGNRNRAAELYGEFVTLWREADPELQSRVRMIEERIVRLRGPG